MDSGIRIDQWALGKSQESQSLNNLQGQLIFSINLQRQVSTILLSNVDQMAEHMFSMDRLIMRSRMRMSLDPIMSSDMLIC